MLAASDLISGRLVCPFSLALPVPYAYWVVCPQATAAMPKITVFRDWLLAEAAADARRLADILPASRRAGRSVPTAP
jgi:LysR family glycine cleavage system transcriptional activator